MEWVWHPRVKHVNIHALSAPPQVETLPDIAHAPTIVSSYVDSIPPSVHTVGHLPCTHTHLALHTPTCPCTRPPAPAHAHLTSCAGVQCVHAVSPLQLVEEQLKGASDLHSFMASLSQEIKVGRATPCRLV